MKSKKSAQTEEMDESIFIDVFGGSAINRVMDFFMTHTAFDYSMTDIAKFSKIAYITAKGLVPELESQGILKMTRIVGKAKMYQTNMDSPIAKAFQKFWVEVCIKNSGFRQAKDNDLLRESRGKTLEQQERWHSK